MKKQILFGGLLMATVGFTACDEDYTDWASPQANEQTESAAAYGLSASSAAEAANIVMPTTSDYVSLVTFGNVSDAVAEVSVKSLIVNDVPVSGVVEGNDVKVLATEIDALLELANWTRESKTYDLTVKTVFDVTLATGETFVLDEQETSGRLTTVPTPEIDPNGYALLGDFVGYGWDPSNPLWMTEVSSGVYEATVETASTENWFKFYRGSAFDDADFQWDAVAYGCATNGDPAPSNLLTWQDDPIWSLQTPIINKVGKWIVTLDMNTCTYNVREAAEALFLTGNNYDWNNWKELVPVYGTSDTFWTLIYLHENEEFKFAPQADWGNDFGMSATINDVAGAGVSGSDNICIANAGWYLLKVVNGATRSVDFLKPEVYLIGETSSTGWEVGAEGLFSVPETEDGEFVSPAFIASNEVRMCISLEGIDWWKTEFIVNADGKIDYRGKGGDQDRVSVEAGQKAYLNFTAGTGTYK